MTTERFYVAVALFHLIAAGSVLLCADWWRRSERCRAPLRRWLTVLGVHAAALAVGVYLLALALTVAVTWDRAWGRRLGPASGRLMSQAVFLESILFALSLAYWHGRAGAKGLAWALGAVGAVITAAYVDAVYVEPRFAARPGARARSQHGRRCAHAARRYAGGLHDFAGTPLHVSRGVGMERDFAPQVRFFCPPEICLLDVRLPAR